MNKSLFGVLVVLAYVSASYSNNNGMKDTIVTFKEKRFHSFLLDKTGLPVFVGNPTCGKDIRVFSCDDGVQGWLRPRQQEN
ncbi:MAG: hypothetical protein OSJ55_05585 [Bacteroidales bacterium]|nr:hypothetical protein [Bacteroidales bacterium]